MIGGNTGNLLELVLLCVGGGLEDARGLLQPELLRDSRAVLVLSQEHCLKLEDGGLETTTRPAALVSQFRSGDADNFLIARVDAREHFGICLMRRASPARGRGRS